MASAPPRPEKRASNPEPARQKAPWLYRSAGQRFLFRGAAFSAILLCCHIIIPAARASIPWIEFAGAQGPSEIAWNSLAARADSLRREMRLARMQLNPRAVRVAEGSYANLLALASAQLVKTETLEPPERAPFRRLVKHLLAARDPATRKWLARRWGRIGDELDQSGEIRFWVGLDAYESERWDEAADCFGGRVAAPLRAYADWLRVRALDKVDEARAAAEALALLQRSPWHPFRGLLSLRAGRHLLTQGDEQRLRQILEPWLRKLSAPSALSARGNTLLAELHRRAGRQDGFIRAFKAASAGGEVIDKERELRLAQAREILSSRKLRSPELVADCLLSLARGAQERSALDAWRAHSGVLEASDSLRVVRVLLEVLYDAREYDHLLDLAAELESSRFSGCTQPAHLAAARVLRRRGEHEPMARSFRAAAFWDEPERTLSKNERALAARALWELGREMEDEGEWARAAEAFCAIVGRFPENEKSDEAALRVALCADRKGRKAEALAHLEQLCASARPRRVGGPCLWRALLDAGPSCEAFLEAAAAEIDPGYFALRARAALSRNPRAHPGGGDSPFWDALSEEIRNPLGWEWPERAPVLTRGEAVRILGLIDGNPSAEAGVLLRAFGYCSWARALWGRLPGRKALSSAGRAALYRGLGDFGRGILLGLRAKERAQRYPVAFSAEVEKAAVRFRLSPGFLLAVMRQESIMEPTVRSRAGAVGLMQLMPATAKRLEDSLSLGAVDLERPRDNVLLGAAHLAELLEKTGESVPMALAAYNGGLDNAERWLQCAGEGKARTWDAYIEGISFAETRRFVKSVLMHYWSYLEEYPQEPSAARSGLKKEPGMAGKSEG